MAETRARNWHARPAGLLRSPPDISAVGCNVKLWHPIREKLANELEPNG